MNPLACSYNDFSDPSLPASSDDYGFPSSGNYGSSTHPHSFNNPAHTATTVNQYSFNIENLELHQLLRNPHVLELHNRCSHLSTMALETSQHNMKLQEELSELRKHTRAGGSSEILGGVRPECYPPSILWLESDCNSDPDITISASNPSRKPMNSAIRREDGSLITQGEYDGIRASGLMIIHKDLLTLPPPAEKRGRMAPNTKSFYKTYYRQHWMAAIREFEKVQPLLSLCAGSWKADHMLGNLLSALSSQKNHRQKGQQSALTTVKENITPSSITEHVIGKRPYTSSSSEPTIPEVTKKPRPSMGPMVGLTTLTGLATAVGLEHTHTKTPGMISVDFIVVRPSFQDLQDIFQQEYPNLIVAKDLLATMKAHPNFNHQEASKNVMEFLNRIEDADPNDPTFDEDNSGPGWGHYQFTSGSLTCATVLTSWAEVGNTNIACRLLAAAIKTAKVARYICTEKNITTDSYISDMYVERVVECLWEAWKSMPGAPTVIATTKHVRVPVAPDPAQEQLINKELTLATQDGAIPSSTAPEPLPTATLQVPPTVANTIPTTTGRSLYENLQGAGQDMTQKDTNKTKSTEDILKVFMNKELKDWAISHGARLEGPLNKHRKNEELVALILNDVNCAKPSEDDLTAILENRIPKKKRTGRSAASKRDKDQAAV